MRLFLYALSVIQFSLTVRTQTPILQLEAFTGVQHIHHHKCNLEDKSYHRGLSMPAGLRFNFNLGDHLAIVPGININNMIGDNLKFPSENILRLDLKYTTPRIGAFDRIGFNVETGIEWVMNQKRIKIPVYLGMQYRMSFLFEWFTRIKIPTILNSEFIKSYDFVEFTIEAGLAINPSIGPAPKFSSTGNPFILE